MVKLQDALKWISITSGSIWFAYFLSDWWTEYRTGSTAPPQPKPPAAVQITTLSLGPDQSLDLWRVREGRLLCLLSVYRRGGHSPPIDPKVDISCGR
jgi:hypothetical protein